VRIEFTPDEMRRWAYAGVDRRISAMQKGRKGAHGFNRDDFWQLDLEGLLAEAAVAKGLGVYFAPVTGQLDTGLGDVLPGIQVRSTKYPSGSLLVHKTDADDDRFLLVTGSQGAYDIRGWCYGSEGKKAEFWKVYKTRGAFWVPQDALRPFEPSVARVMSEAA
jgi:hypothetical protein